MDNKSLGDLLNIFHNIEEFQINHRKLPQYILPGQEGEGGWAKKKKDQLADSNKTGYIIWEQKAKKKKKWKRGHGWKDHLGTALVREMASKSSRIREMALKRLMARVLTDSRFSCC